MPQVPNAGFALSPNGSYVPLRDGTSKSNFLTAAGGTIVKTGAGVFKGIAVLKGATGGAISVYDGVDNTGVLLATFDGTVEGNYQGLNINVSTGIFVAVTNAPNVLVTFV